MLYSPITQFQKETLLKAIGVSSIEDLFSDIPSNPQATPLANFPALSDLELMRCVKGLADKNEHLGKKMSFMGAGAYEHFAPSIVGYLLSRSEFSTSYTPYQPEMSQGTLRAIFEFQTMVCELSGMDIANASVYDGGSALGESCALTYYFFQKQRHQIVVPSTLSPHLIEVLKTYLSPKDIELIQVQGDCYYQFDTPRVNACISEKTAAVVLPYPDFFGTVVNYAATIEKAKSVGAKVIFVYDPLAMGLLKSPGDYGADLCVAEGQSLGLSLAFGGPYLGLMSAKEEFVRFFPGRIVGKTLDRDGKNAYVLTLQTREQHIRREKSYSSICTNQGLMALAATIYLSWMGPVGLQKVASLCCQSMAYFKQEISKIPGFSVLNPGPTIKESLISCPGSAAALLDFLKQQGIEGGVAIGPYFKEAQSALLVAITETKSKADIDLLIAALKRYSA